MRERCAKFLQEKRVLEKNGSGAHAGVNDAEPPVEDAAVEDVVAAGVPGSQARTSAAAAWAM